MVTTRSEDREISNKQRKAIAQQFSLWNESTGFQRFTDLQTIVKVSLYKGFKDLIFHNENCWRSLIQRSPFCKIMYNSFNTEAHHAKPPDNLLIKKKENPFE